MQQHLIEHGAEYIAVALVCGSYFNGLRNRTAERAAGGRIVCQNSAACLGRIGRRRRYIRVKGLHDGLAERLLLVGDLNHEYLQIQSEICACLGECSTPLTGTGFGGKALEALFLGVVRLCDRGIQLVAAGGVVALKLVVDLSRSVQRLLQIVRAAQWRRTVQLIHIEHRLGNINVAGVVVQLLVRQLLTEDGIQRFFRQRLMRARMNQRVRLFLHVRPQVVPLLGHLVFGQIKSVGDLSHGDYSFAVMEN